MAELLVGWLVLVLLGCGSTVWLVARLWRRRGRARLRAPSAVLLAVWLVGWALGALAMALKAFGAVGGQSVDPSQTARLLAEGFSSAVNCTALILLVWIPSSIAVFVLTRARS